MTYELIVTEKPSAAQKIATALADSKPVQKKKGQVSWFELTHNKKPITVTCAVGHLFTVAEKQKDKKWTYPVFDLSWVPSSDVNKASDFTKKYATVIKQLAKKATEFTVATDYDIEGEVIGLNVILHLCKQKDANRMKFSTLTKADLTKAYENKHTTLDWGQALAGKTRHELDWYYGINLSRALSHAIQKAGRFKILSSGRVQGPALKILVDKEKEIKAFVPEPYAQIELHTQKDNQEIVALHKEDKIFDLQKANAILEKVKDQKEAIVNNVEAKQFNQAPPTPFDLTTLQIESHRVHRITPKDTLSLAQDLYIGGFISYPRTSSQKLPKELGLKKLIENLKKQTAYKELVEKLLAQSELKPNEGKKTDDAHPAIFPTGVEPKKLNERQQKIYDLVVRRFLATFAPPAKRETMTVLFGVSAEEFLAKGTRTVEKGWHECYGPYAQFEEVTLPALEKDEKVPVNNIEKLDKETKPPKRYTAASIIKELEKNSLGTKATRAQIVENLYERGYVNEKSIQATDLGIRTCETLEKHMPKIVDAQLTRDFEDEMEGIRHNKKKPEEVLDHSKKILTEILDTFKKEEKEIGEELLSANQETIDITTTVGTCPTCNEGILKIRRGKFGQFIACDKYPDCKTTFSLPNGAKVKPNTDKMCEHCNHPTVLIIRARSKPQEVCINPECPAKQVSQEKIKGEDEPCPKCENGTMIRRKSMYGEFLGCSNYPKCKNTIKIE